MSCHWKSLDSTDWPLLLEQKTALVQLLQGEAGIEHTRESLEGILHLLDALTDEAADRHGLLVFPEEEDAPGAGR